jgi:hypothetical protein
MLALNGLNHYRTPLKKSLLNFDNVALSAKKPPQIGRGTSVTLRRDVERETLYSSTLACFVGVYHCENLRGYACPVLS